MDVTEQASSSQPPQIVEKLKEADRLLNAGQPLGRVLQALGVSEATYHRWRDRYGGSVR